LVFMLLLILLASATQDGRGQTPPPTINYEGEPVVAIDLASRPQVDLEFLRSLIVQQTGQPYSSAKIQQSIAALRGTGEFLSVGVQVSPASGGLRLIFVLQPAYYLGLVQFPGAIPPFPYTRLLQVVSFPPGTPVFREEMANAAGALRTFLHSEGFFLATVTPTTQIDEAHKLVNPVFQITLNRRAKVGTIGFEGLSPELAEQEREALRSFWTHFKSGRLKNGTTFTAAHIQAAVNRIRNTLAASNHLAQEVSVASPNYDPETNRANLVFHVKLGPTIKVQLEGARVSTRQLRKILPIYQENAYDTDLLAESRRDLANYLESKGYFDAQLMSEVQEMPGQVTIVFQIATGRKYKVGKITFTGNHAVTNAALRAAIVVKQKKLLFSRGKYNEALLRASIGKIQNMYRVLGFPEVQVATRVQDLEPDFDITFEITEGMRATVRNFQIIGGTGLETSQLPSHVLRLGPGKPYSPQLAEQDRNDILAYYLQRGYLGAQLKSTATPVNGNKFDVDVVYQIQPGAQTRIQDIVYLGNVKTKTSLIAHATGLQPEMPLSATDMLAAESNLYNLGIFDWTNVGPRQAEEVGSQLVSADSPEEPAPDAGGAANANSEGATEASEGATEQQNTNSATGQSGVQVNGSTAPSAPPGGVQNQEVLVKIHESQRNTIDYGGGLELVSRGGTPPGGAIVVPGLAPIAVGSNFTTSEQRFFSPIGTFSYTRRNLRGRGETLTASILGSRLDNRVTLTYGIPRFWNTNWSSLLSASGERSTLNPIFTDTFASGSIQLQHTLNPERTQSLILLYQFQHTVLSNLLIPNLVLPQDQNIQLSTFSISYVHDTRDKPLDAHRGVYQTLNFGITPEALGASASFVKLLTQSAYYVPVTTHITWANNARLGLAKPILSSRVPLSEEFFSGGSDTLRGFPIDGAGPQRPVVACGNPNNPATCSTISVPVGGNMLLVLNSELRFPIPLELPFVGKGLGGTVFYDGGNVYSNIKLPLLWEKYTNSVGVGITYQTPVGPVRLDIGHLLNPIEGISSVQIFLTLGQAF
jgi:outer membrane protein insertion porin family